MAGFTLMELLFVLVIVGVLGSLASVGLGAIRRKGAAIREIAAGRDLIVAHAGYAADNNGSIFVSLDKTADRDYKVWFPPFNRNIKFQEAPHRYPFRLAPYFGYRLDGTIFVNGNDKVIEKQFKAKIGKNEITDYGVSLYPALGLNGEFIGGTRNASGEVSEGDEVVTRLSQIEGRLLVFVSAGMSLSDGKSSGGSYHVVSPVSGGWAEQRWRSGAKLENYGCVDARHDGKAVCVFTDGSIEMKTIEELRDMRLWSKNAYTLGDPDYVPGSLAQF